MKRIPCFFTVVVLALLFAGCTGKKLAGTDLTNISLDGIRLGSPVSGVDLSQYHNTGRYSGTYQYIYDEIIIDTEQGYVTYLFGRFDENSICISINGNPDCRSIDDITSLLGGSFREKIYDREQRLYEHIYYDYDAQITAEFIYSNLDRTLHWIDLSAS